MRSVGDEPLRILAHIVENELPYTEIVVGDWTMANELLAQAWPLTIQGETGWKKVHYTDARPAAGILSTNSMWWRYGSTASSANRGKANAISKILLCNDYLSKTISFDRSVNLLDDDALNDVEDQPGLRIVPQRFGSARELLVGDLPRGLSLTERPQVLPS